MEGYADTASQASAMAISNLNTVPSPAMDKADAVNGLIPRLCNDLFGQLAALAGTTEIMWTVEAMYLEIYQVLYIIIRTWVSRG
jgi:hypothetical protein